MQILHWPCCDGFVVIAPTHTGDNFQDSSDVGKADWLVNRARQVERAIDMALQSWKDRGHIDQHKIGIFGFSAGATTALINVGGTPDLTRIASQCIAASGVCLQADDPSRLSQCEADGLVPRHAHFGGRHCGPRSGFYIPPNGLSNVHAAVQLWPGAADQTVPYATNAGTVASFCLAVRTNTLWVARCTIPF